MLIALIYMYLESGSFSILDFHTLPLTMGAQVLIFLAFLIAFGVKVPMWPVHTWLPDAHVEAPTGGSVILAAILLKLGGYGFLRFSLPITPDASHSLDWLVITLSLVAVVYIGLVALVQQDMKKLIAYSSIAHMGFVTLGFFVVFGILENTGSTQGAQLGIEGGMVQMVSHGFISGALFLCVGVMYDRLHSRQIADYGGVVHTMPLFAGFMVLFAMANAGLPGTSGFVGEFMVIQHLVRLPGRTDPDPGCRLHAVADQARGVWRGASRGRGHPQGHQRPRDGDPRRACRGGARPRAVAGAAGRRHACQHRQPSPSGCGRRRWSTSCMPASTT
jgi:NADH-quinone oxidoreductase subunit M